MLGVCNKPPALISNRDTLIKNLVDNKSTTSDGNTSKFIGMTMKNGPDLFEDTQIQV